VVRRLEELHLFLLGHANDHPYRPHPRLPGP
jgi:hypothetical protein